LQQGKAMISHIAKVDLIVKHEEVCIETDDHEVHVLRSELVEPPELSILDDSDMGGDPYNSTGTHVIIPPERDLGD
jgi:hypothetical protein